MAYYVYELIDPRDDTVFYVGKGKGSRSRHHEREAKLGVSVSAKCYRIRDIHADGHAVKINVVAQFAKEQDAYDYEAEHVASFPEGYLTNIVPGGGTARCGPFIRADHDIVKACAELANRTRGGAAKWLMVPGGKVDLAEILTGYVERASEVAQRRGGDWVNAIASKYRVEFYAP